MERRRRDRWTIDETFEAVQAALDEDFVAVGVVYDLNLGYPKVAFLDASEELRGDKRVLRAEAFVPHRLAHRSLTTSTGVSTGAGRALATVCAAVLLAGATWFSGTAAVPALKAAWGIEDAEAAALTTVVQAGFLCGTLVYATLNLADVFNARQVFAASALLGAAFNGAFAASPGLGPALVFRFLTGLTLAGVYPVGMKIVASWFRTGLGWRLGLLVGALTLGTASPYLIGFLGAARDWRALAGLASASAVAGGLLVALGVRDGPHLPVRAPFHWRAALLVFRPAAFRWNAFGYFGHMWELYAFWALVGFWLKERFAGGSRAWLDAIPLIAFAAVAAGAVGCVGGGWVSRRAGERRVALVSLLASAGFCLASGLAYALPGPALAAYVVAWGVVVVSDSPQFSALAARYCPPAYTGTALTIQNGVGFAVTVASIHLLPVVASVASWRWAFLVLAPGPLLGAWSMMRLGQVAPDGTPAAADRSDAGRRVASGVS